MQYNIIYRQKDGSWQYIISYKDKDGKWKQKSKQGFELSRKGKQQAKEAAEEALKELQKKAELNLSAEYEGITFEKYKEIFINHQELYKEPNTIKTYNLAFKHFSDLDNLKLDEITSLEIQKCIDKLVENKLKSTTIKTYITRLHTAFNYAVTQLRIIPNNPVCNIDIITSKDKAEKKALSKTELEDLLSKIKNKKYYIISLLAAKCGLRISEILGLTWDDIDEKKGILIINKQWKRLKDGTYNFGELKSINSKREIPIPPNVMAELKKYKTEYPIPINKRLFRYKAQTDISLLLINTYKKIGYNISVHELRHTYATMLIANGVDFKTVAYLMGHNVDQTIKTYSHVTNDMVKNATNLINKIL